MSEAERVKERVMAYKSFVRDVMSDKKDEAFKKELGRFKKEVGQTMSPEHEKLCGAFFTAGANFVLKAALDNKIFR